MCFYFLHIVKKLVLLQPLDTEAFSQYLIPWLNNTHIVSHINWLYDAVIKHAPVQGQAKC